jgi:molybdate transport system regulatory protein
MKGSRLSIDVVLPNGGKLGPAQITLLEAIAAQGSITQAARSLGVSYRFAWLSVQAINGMLCSPAVATTMGGHTKGGAALTPIGTDILALYHTIHSLTLSATAKEVHALYALARADIPRKKAKESSLFEGR